MDTLGVVDRDDILGSARRAAADHAWEDAFAAYRAADALDELSPEDLEALSIVALCASRMPEAVDARQRAYAHYERAGRTPEAASAALNVALLHFGSGNSSAASGWLSRAQRLLDGVPETAAHALLAWIEGQTMARLKAFEQAQDKAREMEAIAGRVGDPDLLAMAISMQGYLRTLTGDVAAGLALIDEALTAVLERTLEATSASLAAAVSTSALSPAAIAISTCAGRSRTNAGSSSAAQSTARPITCLAASTSPFRRRSSAIPG